MQQLYNDAFAFGDYVYNLCLDSPPFPGAPCAAERRSAVDDKLSDFVRGSAFEDYPTFDAFYDAAFDIAKNQYGSIRLWETDGLTVSSLFFPYFSYSDSYLGTLETYGDGVGPRGAGFQLSGDQNLRSIDLSMGFGNDVYEQAIVISGGGITEYLAAGFSGIFMVGAQWTDVNSFSVFTGIGDDGTGIGGMSYGNLVTYSSEVAAVPLPATLQFLAFSLFSCGLLGRRRRKAT